MGGFSKVLEAADKLTPEEQETLIDILNRRLADRRRSELEDVRFPVEIPDGSPDHCLTLQATRAADLGCLRSASSAARRPGKARYPSMRRNCFSATTSPEPTQRSI